MGVLAGVKDFMTRMNEVKGIYDEAFRAYRTTVEAVTRTTGAWEAAGAHAPTLAAGLPVNFVVQSQSVTRSGAGQPRPAPVAANQTTRPAPSPAAPVRRDAPSAAKK